MTDADARIRKLREADREMTDIFGEPEITRPSLNSNRCPGAQRDKTLCHRCDFAIRDMFGRPVGCDPKIRRWWRDKQRGKTPLKHDKQREEGDDPYDRKTISGFPRRL